MSSQESLSKIGPYLIDETLGSGGMGTVYLAHHEQTDQQAAVKVLPASLAREDGFVERFTREINALKQLKNPHIVELNDSGVDGETYYYAMEYVPGETVDKRLRRDHRIPWEEVIAYSIQICSALKAAHDAGIIHRDLKPSNLMVTPDGALKLTDFGVAQIFAANKLTMTGGIIGTAIYMSPEQAQGRRATKQSDLYSLGVVMYVMLTGRPPFTGKTTLDLLQKHRYAQFDMPRSFVPDIPHWLEEVVCKLLEKDPKDRYPDAYVTALRLKDVLKKVEISSQELTNDGEIHEGTATTVAASQHVAPHHGDDVAGTLMRDLMRIEIERSHQASPISNVFNNIWVLLACLLMLIAGGFWWFRNQDPTAEERFQAGVALLNQPAGPEWLTARDQYFLPLVDNDRQRWKQQVEPFLNRIEEYELTRSFSSRPSLRKLKPPANDAERFVLLAQRYQEMGDSARAERTLVALQALLAGDAQYDKLYKLTQRQLTALRSARAEQAGEHELLKTSTARAKQLADSNRLDEARKIWIGIVELYGSDDSAKHYVQEAKRLLEQPTMADQ